MPTTNARKHQIPAGSDLSINRATIFETFGNSINDVIPVANVTERSQLVSALNAKGVGPSSTNPLVVIRADAPGLHRIEYTYDGTVWLSDVLTFASKSTADAFGAASGGLLIVGDECVISGVRWRWSGSDWKPRVRFATFTFTRTGAPDGLITDGIIAAVTAETTDSTLATIGSASLTLQAGVYDITFSITGSIAFGGRSFLEFESGGRAVRVGITSGEDKTAVSASIMLPAAAPVSFRAFKTSGGTNLSGFITIRKAE